MNLTKKHIHRNQVIGRSTLQFPIDEDFNVPDVKPDMAEVLHVKGEARILEQRVKTGKCYVRGVLCCTVLYASDESAMPLQVLDNEVPFDEVMNMDDGIDEKAIHVQVTLEELSVRMIHSRKYGIRGMLRLNLVANRLVDVESAVEGDVTDGSCERKTEDKILWSLAADCEETYHFRDSVLLSGSKPEVQTLLCKELAFRGTEFRPQSEQLSVKGELEVFLLYVDDKGELAWVCEELPVTTTIPVSGLSEEMVPHIVWRMGENSVTAMADNDGEMRIIDVEAALTLHITAYKEETCKVLTDLYSVTSELTPIYRETVLENVMNKNLFRFREGLTEKLPETVLPVKTICYAGGDVKVDVMTLQEDGLLVEGVVEAYAYYESEAEGRPIGCHRVQIPFSQLVEIRGIRLADGAKAEAENRYLWEVEAGLDQVSATVTGERELEWKAAVRLETLMLERENAAFLIDVTEAPLAEETLLEQPSIVFYPVKIGDEWWDIAKGHMTTLERIAEYNECDITKAPVPGNKLMLVRVQV